MNSDLILRTLLPSRLRHFPTDLAAVLGLVILTVVVSFTPIISESLIQTILWIPFVLFTPGYALIAVLFPSFRSGSRSDGESESGVLKPGLRERLIFSLAASIAISPLVGLALNFLGIPLRRGSVLVALGGVTVALTGIAAARRSQLPPTEQFDTPTVGLSRIGIGSADTPVVKALQTIAVVALLLTAAGLTYAVAAPDEGESPTEFYLLADGPAGELVAADYPTNLSQGESSTLYVGVKNREGHEMSYTVLIRLQRVAVDDNDTRVLQQRELRRYQFALESSQSRSIEHTITPRMTGERLRLTYLLYRGQAPPSPTAENAYREVHLWLSVSDGESNGGNR